MRSVAFTCASVLFALGAIVPSTVGKCTTVYDSTVSIATQRDLKGPQSTQCFKDKLGTCFGRLPKDFDGTASSMTWTHENGTVVLYDGHLCGGYSIAFRKRSPYKKVQPNGFTEDAVYVGDSYIPDLSLLCKFDSCGYSSTVDSQAYRGDCTPDTFGTDDSTPPSPKDKCKCTETWDKSIRSMKLLPN